MNVRLPACQQQRQLRQELHVLPVPLVLLVMAGHVSHSNLGSCDLLQCY